MPERIDRTENMKEIPLRGVAIRPLLQSILGEKYCTANRIVVLEDTPSAIKVAVPEHSLPCIDEIRKVLPRQKGSISTWGTRWKSSGSLCGDTICMTSTMLTENESTRIHVALVVSTRSGPVEGCRGVSNAAAG